VIRPDLLRRAEWALALLLTATSLLLLGVRANRAGALWRDECAVVNLAQMPTVSDIAQNFQHEAFPVPFPLLVRAYSSLFGRSDFALRGFGILAALALLCAMWWTAKFTGHGPPLLALALIGLNATVLFWGTTVRGYGLGAAFIIAAFGSFAALLLKLTTPRLIIAGVVSVATVQCLVHNLALIAAFVAGATIVALLLHDFKRLVAFLGILALCLISFVPYLGAYSSSWSEVVEFPVSARLLWNQLAFALGNPNAALAWLWRLAFIVLIIAAVYRLCRTFRERSAQWNVLLFAAISAIVAPIAYYKFLQTLSYLTRSWYFIALIAALGIALDCLAAILATKDRLRISRLLFAAAALVVLPINAWPVITQRQTNIDIIAQKIATDAKPSDLIVLAPWQYAISFQRYYHGSTPQITLPSISDLRVHRYDLFREKMLAEHPIDNVLEKIRQTLTSGNRVWLVGGIKLPPEGRAPRNLPPASTANGVWDNIAYSDAWMEQLGIFVRQHTQRGQNVSLPARGPINPFEDVPLLVVDGWQ